jgi:hypothetical protein
MLQENIKVVQRGDDPFGVIRDLNHPMIETRSSGEGRARRAAGEARVTGGGPPTP